MAKEKPSIEEIMARVPTFWFGRPESFSMPFETIDVGEHQVTLRSLSAGEEMEILKTAGTIQAGEKKIERKIQTLATAVVKFDDRWATQDKESWEAWIRTWPKELLDAVHLRYLGFDRRILESIEITKPPENKESSPDKN